MVPVTYLLLLLSVVLCTGISTRSRINARGSEIVLHPAVEPFSDHDQLKALYSVNVARRMKPGDMTSKCWDMLQISLKFIGQFSIDSLRMRQFINSREFQPFL